jgi:iron complex outermembrane receptor protein
MKIGTWLFGSAAALCIATPASAQVVSETAAAPQASDEGVAEIIVTARKRTETAQSVPATIDLISAETIVSRGVQSFSDISTVAPSVNISNSPTPSMFSITIRGLGSEPGNPSFDSSVSLFVDGVYTPRAREFSSSIFDVGGIETIKGTQAALLGKNTSLGAVNLTTRKPGTELGFDMRYSHEFELESNRVEGGMDLPLSDTLQVRVAGLYDNDRGAIRNLIDGSYGPNARISAGRMVVAWAPAPTIDVTAMYQVHQTVGTGSNAEFVRATGAPPALGAAAGYPGKFEANLDNQTAMYASAIGGTGRGVVDSQRGSLTINVQLGEHTLTSQTGYTKSDASSSANVSFLPGNYGLQFVDDASEQFTQEIRLTSPEGQPIDYIVGLLYLNGSYDNYTTGTFNYPGTPPITGSSLTRFNQDNRAWSGFGQLDAELVSNLKVSVGLRYTSEKKSVDLSRTALIPGIYSTVVLPPYAPMSMSKTEGNVDASFGLSYQATPNFLVYGSVGQGTKAGGYAQAASNLTRASYEPERARTGEFGFKSQFDNRRLTINAAAFYTEVRDFQLVTFTGISFDVANTNLKSYGVESEISWVPMRALRLFWNNTYAHAEDTLLNSETTHAPRWAGIAGFGFTPEIADGIRLALNGDVTYKSSQIGQRNQANVIRLEASTRFNAGIGLEHDIWSVRLIGKNLNDERKIGFVFPAPLLPAGNVVGIPLEPRTIMLQLGFKY